VQVRTWIRNRKKETKKDGKKDGDRLEDMCGSEHGKEKIGKADGSEEWENKTGRIMKIREQKGSVPMKNLGCNQILATRTVQLCP
jgi:hypothetical protein